MRIAFHGGYCCGMKTIHGLGVHPNFTTSALSKTTLKDNDAGGDDFWSHTNFFHEGAPAETYVERLDRYLEFLAKRRPNGIVEITLANSPSCSYYDQVTPWRPLLEERGFKEVNNCMNSNSGNRVFVFHKNME